MSATCATRPGTQSFTKNCQLPNRFRLPLFLAFLDRSLTRSPLACGATVGEVEGVFDSLSRGHRNVYLSNRYE